jgi:two-component system, chemotaxis family, response regulator Rcp1
VRLDGEVRDVEVAACPFADQGGLAMQVVLHDITERRLLERGILTAVEREQHRVGRDLHDGLCQLLTAAKYKTSLIERKLARGTGVSPGEAAAIERQLNEAIQQAHNLAHGLSPVKLLARGLVSALEELAASIESAFPVQCNCDFPEALAVEDHTVANHLYRIAQEAIHNALKHGKARSIRITLRKAHGGMELEVVDDGVGIPAKAEEKGGMGLSNMKARAGPCSKRVMNNIAFQPIEVLLVEDSPSDIELTVEALQMDKMRNHVSVVEDGVQAMEFLRRQGPYTHAPRPDLILLDLGLPRKDGRQVLAEIRADESLKTIPVAVLTASCAEWDMLRSYQLNANCYIAKPVDAERLLEVVRSIESFWFMVVTLPAAVEQGHSALALPCE